MWKDWVHPLLFGLYVPLSIFVFNSAEVTAAEIASPLAAVVAATLLVLAAVRWSGRDLRLAAIALSLFWLVFFQFANLRSLPGLSLLGDRAAALVMFAALAGIVVLIGRLAATARDAIATAMLLAGVAFNVQPVLLLPASLAAATSASNAAPSDAFDAQSDTTRARTRAAMADGSGDEHDVFWILVDAYAGERTLSRYFGFDNGPFLEDLRRRGFVVSLDSHSNYDRTLHSLSSNLNMAYVDAFAGGYPEDHRNNRPLREAIYASKLFGILRESGYTISMFASSSHLMPPDSPGYLDVYESYMSTGQYSLAVIANTPLQALFKADKLFMPLDGDRKPWVPDSIDWTFAKGLVSASNGRKDFVFLHVLCPHEPFYFNADCSIADARRTQSWSDFDDDFSRYRDAYRANLQCVNRKLEAFFDRLAATRGDLPIIVLQGDHGPNEILASTIEREGFDRYLFQTNVLNAFRLPESDRGRVENGMSLVNTWRAVLPALGIPASPSLPHRSYSTATKKPFMLRPLEPGASDRGKS
jgi:hypothetical protein